MVKDVYYGKTLRKSFARHEEILQMPYLLEVQKNSYQWFLDTGPREVFKDVGSISDYAGNLELSCVDFLYAPVKKGSVCGTARVVCGDTVLGETELLCGSEVQLDTAQEDLSRKERFLLWWDRLRKRIVT